MSNKLGNSVESVECWDHMTDDFIGFVSRSIRFRLQKYQQPDHPLHLSDMELKQLHGRMLSDIIMIEKKAFEEYENKNMKRPVAKSKLESNIKTYIKKKMQQFYANFRNMP